jgi:hypothetical protein
MAQISTRKWTILDDKKESGMSWDLSAAEMMRIVRKLCQPKGHFALMIEFESQTQWTVSLFNDLSDRVAKALYKEHVPNLNDVWVCTCTVRWTNDATREPKFHRMLVPRQTALHETGAGKEKK